MEGSRTSLEKWAVAIYEMVKSKNSISTCELAGEMQVAYKTAWKIGMKIRLFLMSEENYEIMEGIFELDEKLIGGYHKAKGPKRVGHNGQANKICVFGIKRWGLPVRLFHIEKRDKKTLLPIILENIKKGSTIYTDQYAAYQPLTGLGFIHDTVNHKKREWARGPVTTQRIEGIWNQIDKAYRGTYVWLSKKNAEGYFREFEFRHTTRKMTKREKFDLLIARLFSCRDIHGGRSPAISSPSPPVPQE